MNDRSRPKAAPETFGGVKASLPRKCPDCGAVTRDEHLIHDTTCPLGLGIDRVCASDRRWFQTHPGAGSYWRDVDQWEVADLRANGVIPDVPGRAIGRVRVTRVGEGIRVRTFEAVSILAAAVQS